MTREQAKQNLIGLGIAEPSDEAVTNYLNQVNGESQKEKDRAAQYKKDADKVTELKKQLEEMQNANLTDIEKANKATEDANKQIANLEKEIVRMKNQKQLAELGITGEDASSLLNEDGTLNFETLGKIISDRETNAATRKEQEIAKNATNPNGGRQAMAKDEKPDDVKNAESISFGNRAESDEKDYYKL